MRQILYRKYSSHYRKEMGNFEFDYEEVTFEIMMDFNGWKICSFQDGDENIIIFYEED